MMLLLFGLALSNEPANVPWAVLDRSHSRRVPATRARTIVATGYFLRAAAGRELRRGPKRCLHAAARGRAGRRSGGLRARRASAARAEVQVLLDGADPLSAARVGGICARPRRELRSDRAGRRARAAPLGAAAGRRRRATSATALLVQRHARAIATSSSPTLAGMLLTNLCLSLDEPRARRRARERHLRADAGAPDPAPRDRARQAAAATSVVSYVVLAIALLGAGLVFGVWPPGQPARAPAC